jgi:amiloride-sensitive sodium channel
MRWKDSEYFALIRFQEYNYVDFFSYAGGILGLFAGISVLSIIETVYFLTMRLTTDCIRFLRQ